MSNPLLSHFPKQLIPRDCQIELLETLWQTLATTKKITLASPCGSGKSLLALTIMKYMESLGMRGLYTTPLNTLVDQFAQYECVVDGIATLKGRKHYPCVAGKPDASQGYCRDDECPPGVVSDEFIDATVRFCQRCKRADKCPCTRCVYRQAFKRFVMAPVGNTNFTMAMLGINNKPEIIIIDEIDSIESFVRMHHTHRFKASLHSMDDLGNHIKILQTKLKTLSDQRVIETDTDKDKLTAIDNEYKLIKKDINKASMILDDFEKYKEPWNTTINNNVTTFEPITTDRFVDEVTEGLITIMMSATPPRREGYALVESGSPFPKEIRPWSFEPVGKMSLKYREKTIPKIAKFLTKTKLKGKSLVHCTSYQVANDIGRELQKLNVFPLVQSQRNDHENGYEQVLRNEAIQSFKSSKDMNKILLAVNLTRGVDFNEPEIQNNIISTVPFPNPSESLTKAKNKLLGTSWQKEHIATAIEQSHGRVHRGIIYYSDLIKTRPELVWLPHTEDDIVIKRTIILDSNWGWWYPANKKLFTKDFRETENKSATTSKSINTITYTISACEEI